MRGYERERKTKTVAPKTTIGSTQIVDLSLAEKQDLVLFSGTPAYSAILRLMETMLVEARDEAVLASPANQSEQLAALNIAHAMSKLYVGLKRRMTFLVEEHLGSIKHKAAEEAMLDQQNLASILLDPINAGH